MMRHNVLVLGAKGVMGRRYCAILRYLGHKPIEVDLPWPHALTDNWDYAIVATPTQTHVGSARQLLNLVGYNGQRRRDVLMEKPVATSMTDLCDVARALEDGNMALHSVNQYNYLPEVVYPEPAAIPLSWYRYYNHGRDGIMWDCFQIYALAKDKVSIDEKSPHWDCGINGRIIDFRNMDWAYIDMIEDWLGPQNRVWGWDVIERTTRRILETT